MPPSTSPDWFLVRLYLLRPKDSIQLWLQLRTGYSHQVAHQRDCHTLLSLRMSEDGSTDRRRRRRRKPHTSDASPRNANTEQLPSLLENEFARPMDNAALREARLKAMDTPTTERKRMKVEYQYVRPVKAPSVISRKSTTKATSTIFGPRSSVIAVRPRTTRVKSAPATTNESENEYVYRRPPSVIRRDFQSEHDHAARDSRQRAATGDKSTGGDQKPKLKRRQTETILPQKRQSADITARPALRRSTTSATTERKKPAVSSAFSGATLIDSEKQKKSAQASSSSRRSRIFGSLIPLTRSKSTPTTTSSKAKLRRVSCLTCGADDILPWEAAKLPCAHRMCHPCLRRVFELSLKDPALMPPRCCTSQDISLSHVDKLFSEEFKRTWNRKYKEYKAKNRLYCPRKDCGEWIQAKHISQKVGRRVGTCPKCKMEVCGLCGMRNHRSRECPKDPAIKDLDEMAGKEGWRRCYNCNAMVELKEGCNHMTCRCLAEFCMVCGVKWKGCDCPWFNYTAVNDGRLGGDPVRYQEEMDRRREQERMDEELARRMAGLGRAFNRRDPDQNFLQQAREVLTANYPNAELAAQGLLGGWLNGREAALGRARPEAQQPPGASPEERRAARRRPHRTPAVRPETNN